MLTRLWSFLTGYVSLVVEGKTLEKLLNMAVSRGLYIWDVQWLNPGIAKIKVRLNGIMALRHIARRTKCRFKISGKGGLPFEIAKIKKRKLLLSGAIISIILIYMMSSFIWFVEVRGNKKIPTSKIIHAAEDAGLAMGTLKTKLDKDKIERYIENELPEASWIGIKITGTKAVIEIAEKNILKPTDNTPANVVADRDALIDELLVLSGKAAVNEGDMVKKGDVIISGVIKPEPKPEDEQNPENKQEVPQEPVRYVRARGIVRAKIWYEGYGEARIVEQGTRRTGRQTERLSIKMFGKELILKGPKTSPYHDYVSGINIAKLPEWRNLRIPVEIVTTNYYEVKKYRDIIGLSDAKSNACEKARADALAKLTTRAKIVREISEEIQARGSNVIRVKVVLETIEEIGRVEPLRQEDKQLN